MGKIYKFIRLVGASKNNYEEAISSALEEANQTVRNMSWFQVVEQRGSIDNAGKVSEWQATIDVAFRVDKKG